jgi:hypothetical protein
MAMGAGAIPPLSFCADAIAMPHNWPHTAFDRFRVHGYRANAMPVTRHLWPIKPSSPNHPPEHIPVNNPHPPEVKIICVVAFCLKWYGSETRYGSLTWLICHIEFHQFFQPLLSALIVLSFVTDFFFF